jgi:hypothetical protein
MYSTYPIINVTIGILAFFKLIIQINFHGGDESTAAVPPITVKTKYGGGGHYSDVGAEKSVRATEPEVARIIAIVVAVLVSLSSPYTVSMDKRKEEESNGRRRLKTVQCTSPASTILYSTAVLCSNIL